MRGRGWRPGIGDLLTVFVALDVVAVSQLLAVLGLGAAGLVMAAMVVVLWVVFQTSPNPRRRAMALAGLLIVLFLLPQALLVAIRPPTPPVNDGIPMTEAAAGRLLQGLDPYGHDYIDDPATRSFFFSDQPVNFAFRHYVYPPVTILLAVPGRVLGFGFAWMWLGGLIALAVSAYGLGRRAEESQAAAIAVVLSPALFLDYVSLLNDLFFLAAALGAIGLLRRGRPIWAGVLLGLALATKQQTVLFGPLVAMVAWRELTGGQRARFALAAAATFGALVLPFVAWGASAFLADTAGYSYGAGVDSFPIRGFGLPAWLLRAHVIQNRWAPYPATLAQAALALPVLAAAWLHLRRRWSWAAAWCWTAALAFAVFLGGRYFAPNYLTLVLIMLSLGLGSWLVDRPPAALRAL